MNLFSYVVRIDDGNAPNPYGGFLTLTVCKPRIRKHARKGDILLGTGSARSVGTGTLVYAAVISEVIPIADYGKLAKYRIKRPGQKPWWRQLGDNLYFRENGRWQRRKNPFHSAADMSHDLSGINALICKKFWYFGRAAGSVPIPDSLQEIIKAGRGHRRIRDKALIARVVRWLETLPQGRHDEPYHLDDQTFVTGCVARTCSH
jgi:hypothetical protein